MYAILSDIHGNLFALEAVARDMERFAVEGIILLGDLIDYGMQSNEAVEFIESKWEDKLVCNLWGNHERAILTPDFTRFSSQRGVESAKHTATVLTEKTRRYLCDCLVREGHTELVLAGRRVLAVHGSQEDVYWKAIAPGNLRGDYCGYDLVLSGHSHYSHFFQTFYETEDPDRRNRHATFFINPGSVGQPRNHNPAAQYALLDPATMSVDLRAVEYDVSTAMLLFDGSVDDFYRARLKYGV
ncbi:MAG: metallophosphoesterase family protein [Oscillospiraceae bacterium]|nr:metallophosphoesterase family protein [Oscillospiraceae bacterium]